MYTTFSFIYRAFLFLVLATIIFGCSTKDKEEATEEVSSMGAPMTTNSQNNPKYSNSLTDQGETMLEQKKETEARKAFEKALRFSRNNKRAKAYLEILNTKEVIESYKKRHALYPEVLSDIEISNEYYQYATKGMRDTYCLLVMDTVIKKELALYGEGCNKEMVQEFFAEEEKEKENSQEIHIQSIKQTSSWGFGYYNKLHEGFFLIDKEAFGPFDEIDEHSPYFASDGRKAFIYWKDKAMYVQVGDKVFGEYKGENPKLFFYEGGWILHYEDKNKKHMVIVDGRKEYGPHVYVDILQTQGKNWGFRYCNFNTQKYADILLGKDVGFTTKCYIVANQQEKGPYDMVEQFSVVKDGVQFVFTQKDDLYIYNEGVIRGPYAKKGNPQISFEEETTVLRYQDAEGNHHLEIGPDILGPLSYASASKMHVFEKQWGFQYKDEENRKFIVVNGRTYGPYTHVSDPVFGKNGWGFVYKDSQEKNYVMINSEENGPYLSAGRLLFTNANTLYQYEKNKGEYYISVNGKSFGPYKMMKAIKVSGKQWGFEYKEDNDLRYLMVNGMKYGPYEEISPSGSAYDPKQSKLNIREQGGWVYHYHDTNGKDHIVVNGEDFGPYNHQEEGQFIYHSYMNISEENEDWAFQFEDSENLEYQVVNGDMYGPFKIVEKNMFHFGKKDWGFTYQNLEDEYYVVISGEQYGPYTYASPPTIHK